MRIIPGFLQLSWLPPAVLMQLPAAAQNASLIQGLNTTAGNVRVCNLANAEAFLNIFANFFEIVGIWLFCFYLIKGITAKYGSLRWRSLGLGAGFLLLGLSLPGLVNSCIAWAREANLFS